MLLDAALDTALSEPTAEAETPQTDATAAAPQTLETPPTPTATYTRKDVDAAYAEAERFKKQLREQYAQREQQLRRELEQLRQPQPETDPGLRAQIEAIVGPVIAPIKQQAVEVSLDRAVVALGKQYPEFNDEAKVRAIFGTVVDMGLDKASHLPIDRVLEMGYRYWKHDELSKLAAQPPVDVEAIKKQAADEAVKAHITRKVDTASKAPRSEGSGGQGTVTPAKKITKVSEMESALEAALSRVE